MAGRSVAHDEDLLMTGALDSLSVARLITFIETRFEITVPIADVLPENMGTIDALTSYIISKNTI